MARRGKTNFEQAVKSVYKYRARRPNGRDYKVYSRWNMLAGEASSRLSHPVRSKAPVHPDSEPSLCSPRVQERSNRITTVLLKVLRWKKQPDLSENELALDRGASSCVALLQTIKSGIDADMRLN